MKKYIVDDYDLFAKHEYYVLKKDRSVKHGAYKSTWVNGNPRQEGFYYFGEKDSLWIYYNRLKALVASRGYYEKGEKVGIWEYLDDDGKIMNRYDHSFKFLSYTTFQDTVLAHTIRMPDTTFEVKLDRSPVYLEGERNKFRIIQDNIVYPTTAIQQNVFGTVMVSFYINTEGKAVDYELLKKIGGGCDEEALRVVKLIPNEWVPAVYKDRYVEARIVMPITFQLN